MRAAFFLCLFFMAQTACSSAPPRVPEPLAEAVRARNAGSGTFEAGRYHEALRNFQDAERRFVAIDDDANAALAAISQAEILLLFGEVEQADAVTSRAAHRVARTGGTETHNRVRLLQARIAHERNDASATQQLEDLLGASPAIAQQSRLLLCQRAISAGETECLRALSSNDPLTQARIERLRADVLSARNEHEQAHAHLDNALNIYRAHFYRPGVAAMHETRADSQVRSGDTDGAIASLRRALYLRLWIHDGVHAVSVLQRLAELSENNKDRERYQRWHEWLSGESDPAWETILQEIFTPR